MKSDFEAFEVLTILEGIKGFEFGNIKEETFEIGCLTISNSSSSSVCALCDVAFLLLPSRDRVCLGLPWWSSG